LTRITIGPELRSWIRQEVSQLQRAISGRNDPSVFAEVYESNRRIADEIERRNRTQLHEIVEAGDLESLGEFLAQVHREISGVKDVSVSVGTRRISMKVSGCSKLGYCNVRSRGKTYFGCVADMVVAAILQRALNTPVKIEVVASPGVCCKEFSPAWLVELLKGLDAIGVQGLVVVYKDRVLFSQLPSGAEAEALSQSLLINEEELRDRKVLEVRELQCPGRRIILVKEGDLFVSLCLRMDADEKKVQRHVTDAVKKAVAAL